MKKVWIAEIITDENESYFMVFRKKPKRKVVATAFFNDNPYLKDSLVEIRKIVKRKINIT